MSFMSSIVGPNSLISSSNVGKVTAKNCREKYPNMVPVHVEAQEGIKLTKNKFLISEDTSGLEFQRYILNFVQVLSHLSLYCFIVDKKNKKRMLPYETKIKTSFDLYQNEDGFLKVYLRHADAF